MIILDTNVISEPMKLNGDPAVQNWLDQQVAESLYITSISLAELLVGIALLPEGRRKQGLDNKLTKLITNLFDSRLLAFDQSAAIHYAALMAHAQENGQTLSLADGQIAAIAAVHGYTVATRDTQPFIAAGIAVINPWGKF